MLKIQANVIGFDGRPATVFSGYDEKTLILGIATIAKNYQRDRAEGCLLITNDLTIERDSLFTMDDLSSSIQSYFDMAGSTAIDGITPRLAFRDAAQRAKPTIEKDGMDENGIKYRISEDSTCGQIAVLATCWFCYTRVTSIESAIDMFDELNNFNNPVSDFEIGGIISI